MKAMDFYKFLLVFGITSIFTVDVYCILIQRNAYDGISIGFSDQVQQQHFDFDKLKKVLVKSSELLFRATRKRSYFGSFTLVLPGSWSADFCRESVAESPEMINIYITNFMKNSSVRAQHSKGCSEEGEIIYLPLNLLNGETEDLARQFLQQWSIYRYGVFEESPLEEAACYASAKGDWSPVGCYNVKIPLKPELSEDGLPYCPLTEDILLSNIKSSLMTNFTKALDYCDGSPEFPHNPVMPTLHNNLCEGKTVWSIIEDSEDFKHGKNTPANFNKPPVPSFKCFREPAIQLTFAIQTCSTNNITPVVQEIRYTLFHFLRNLIPTNIKINLVTFSDNIRDSIELNLENEEKLREELDLYVATTEIVTSTCLLCGIQKAMNVSQAKPSTTVVILAWESSLMGEKTSNLIQSMKENVRLHLLLVKDTNGDVIPIELVKAVRSAGGFIHSLPKPTNHKRVPQPNVLLNSQLNVILSSVVASPLEVEDRILVVHDGKYTNDTEVLDTFSIPPGTVGKLIYTMHCDLKGQISVWDRNCFRWDEKSTTFLCGNVLELNGMMNRTWQYKFGIQKGVDMPVCASTAILFKSSSSSNSFSLRGWLNEYVVNPGENALIIYAEITNRSPDEIFEVLAHISGPGMASPFEIELWDNGNGDPDVKLDDGIYSRYFTSFEEKGTYTVTISARASNTKEINAKENELGSEDSEIQQKKVIGSFSVSRKPSEIDIIPPNRVADLKIIAIDHENSNVTLQWTAPGNNYDFGQATKYEIKYATRPGSLQKLYFDSEDAVKLEERNSPKLCGELEMQTFKFPNTNRSVTYNVALRAIDANKNKGKISNIVQFYMLQSKTLIVDPDKSSTEYIDTSSISPTSSQNISDIPKDMNYSSTEPSSIEPSSTDDLNTTDVPEQTKQGFVFDTKYKILLYSVGAVILFIIIVNIFIWCYCSKKRSKQREESKKLSRKSSLRPPYNINISYQQESESATQSETDISISNLADPNSYSPAPAKQDNSPNYSFHTSKSLLSRSKSKADSELGFKVVQPMPAYATTSLSRFAKRLSSSETEPKKPSVAQPQQPSSNNENYVYSLGVV